MFNHILLPLDGSLLAEGVLPHAAALGRTFEARLTLLQIMEKQEGAQEAAGPFDTLSWQIQKDKSHLYLEDIRDRLEAQGLQVEAQLEEGRVAEGIVVFAENQGVELVILSSHGRSGVSYWGISSITQKVIYSAPASVLLVRAQDAATGDSAEHLYGRILVPLDGSRRAESVFPAVQRLARAQGSELLLAHVVPAPEMARHLPPVPEDRDIAEKLVSRNREEAEQYLEQVIKSSAFEGIDVQTHLMTGSNAATALHELVEQQQIGLVVMSAHGYSGSEDWPYGGLVNNFITYGKTHLLVVQDLPPRRDLSAPAAAAREQVER